MKTYRARLELGEKEMYIEAENEDEAREILSEKISSDIGNYLTFDVREATHE